MLYFIAAEIHQVQYMLSDKFSHLVILILKEKSLSRSWNINHTSSAKKVRKASKSIKQIKSLPLPQGNFSENLGWRGVGQQNCKKDN